MKERKMERINESATVFSAFKARLPLSSSPSPPTSFVSSTQQFYRHRQEARTHCGTLNISSKAFIKNFQKPSTKHRQTGRLDEKPVASPASPSDAIPFNLRECSSDANEWESHESVRKTHHPSTHPTPLDAKIALHSNLPADSRDGERAGANSIHNVYSALP